MSTTTSLDADAQLAELVATPEGRADPYPRYAKLRELAPVHHSTFGIWALTRYDDCQHVLRHPGVGKDFSGAVSSMGLSEEQQKEQARFRSDHSNMLLADPPDHTRLRGLASRAFTPRTVEGLRARIEGMVEDLIDSFGDGEVDLMQALAFPLPVTVIGEMLGVPTEDRAQLRPLVRAVTAVLELVVTSEQWAAAVAANTALEQYFTDLVAERRARPQDDLLSKLILADDEGDRLTGQELVSTSILLFAAGFETTTNLIGNALLALVRHPDQLERLRSDRTLVKAAVEEVLRWESPVQIAVRTVYEEMELRGQCLEAGSTVIALLGAANRDPNRFSDPDRFDVGRSEGSPLSFGAGIHFCLGAALARMEGHIVLDHLLDRFGTFELVGGPPAHRDSLTLRGLGELRMRFTP